MCCVKAGMREIKDAAQLDGSKIGSKKYLRSDISEIKGGIVV